MYVTAPSRHPPPSSKDTRHSTPTPTPTITTLSSSSHLQQIHAQLIKSGTPITAAVSLSDVAAVCALASPSTFSYARRIFHRAADRPEIMLWNSAIRSFSESGSPADALRLFSRLHGSDIPHDTFTCSFVLKACSQAGALDMGRAVHGLIEKTGFPPDLFLRNTIIQMYASCGRMDDAGRMFDKMPSRDAVTWNIMITQLTKIGEMEAARRLFDSMPDKSVRAWTALIAGYVQCRNPKEAIRVFHVMEEAGMKPSEVTVVAVLAACADIGALDLGKRVHEYSDLCGFQDNVRICNTLIDMYIKCGCVENARRVFDGMGLRTVVSWSAMIAGHAMHGQGGKALQLFSEMSRLGVQPNGVTFIGLLHACSHMGLVEEGHRFFASMTRDYGIDPEIEHYGCMVDLLSRAGLLAEAREFVRRMPVEPNGVVWGALLGGARLHKSVEMGEEAIRHLATLDPLNDGYYVVLSNIYADARRWEDAARIRCLMRDRGVKKTPGWSTISLDGVVHEFVAGESDHPQVEKIYSKWDELLVELRLRGYVPDTSAVLLDMDEVEKEHVLYRHSEKLAVVFGLMSTAPGTTIRIMKNLRVCSDCHAALKLISGIFDREIIVRDRNRFHCFKHGSCSCGDYW